MEIVTKQEIEWLIRVEEVLKLPKGKLISAVILNRTLTVLDILFPPDSLKMPRKQKKAQRFAVQQQEEVKTD